MQIIDLFPSLKGLSSQEVNLNEEARNYLLSTGIIDTGGTWLKINPLIQPEICQDLLKNVHEKYNIIFSHGGYGEDRSTLWHDTYLDRLKTYYHLGVDINIPAATEIHSPISGEVLVSDHDRDHPGAPQNHGWGNRLIIKPHNNSKYALILAHLSEDTRRKTGSVIGIGELLGTIGNNNQNGGWFEHFHAQAISLGYLKKLIDEGKLAELDGYAGEMNADIRERYPHPLETF